MLALIDYLCTHFLTRAQLAARAGISEDRLAEHQRAGAMPAASYVLELGGSCDSFFGLHEARERAEFYAAGYCAWLGALEQLDSAEAAQALFARRYRARIAALFAEGYTAADPRLHAGLDAHIASEWQHFQKGIYGLCTRSGLPEDIAAKELAVIAINEIAAGATPADLDAATRARLARAVDLLDAASSAFAPHERARSSRHRLVDGVRRAYGL